MSGLGALTGALLSSLWQVLVVAAGYALLRLLVRGSQPRYLLALAALAVQLAWPAVTLYQQLGLLEGRYNTPLVAQSQWWLVAPLAWAVGVAGMAARTAGGLWVVRRWVRTAAALEETLLARFEQVAKRLGVRAVTFGSSPLVDVPLTVGWLRPVVLLPVSLLSSLDVQSLELLVAHELMHVRRWDAAVNVAQLLVEALLFFHPAMWWVSRCAREEREYCCDDAVVQYLGGAARPYAEALLALEHTRQPAAVSVASTGGAFVNRIRRLLGSRSSRSVWPFGAVLVAMVGGATALALNATAPVKLVSVSPELKPVLEGLCSDFRAEPCRPELVQLKAPPEDLMTIVIADQGEKSAELEQFFTQVFSVPAAQRHDSFTTNMSNALGKPWVCPEFETMWAMQPVTWCGAP